MKSEINITSALKDFIAQYENISEEKDAEFNIFKFLINDLNWRVENVIKQKKTHNKVPDIALVDRNCKKIFIEVKHPNAFKTDVSRNKAIKQLVKYMLDHESSYGIVTDSAKWIFVRYIYADGIAHKIHYFDLLKHDQFDRAKLTFKLLTEDNINELLDALANINGGLNEKEFEVIMNLNKTERINNLILKHYDTGSKPDPNIKALIANIYSGGITPVRYLYKLGMGKAIKVI